MNLILIEDEINIQLALSQYLKAQPEFTNLAVFSTAEEFENTTLLLVPDIIVLDINLPKKSGIELIPIIKNQFPEVSILMLSINNDNESVFFSLQAGADGYLGKETPLEKIKEAIIDLRNGGSPITPVIARKVFDFFNSRNTIVEDLNEREKQIVQGIVDGLSYKLIAFENNISIDTVRKYIKTVYKKLQINSKGELISKYHHHKN
jgi:DNA-binding NarL/FixJ family response regulator